MPSRLANSWSDRARPIAISSNHARPRGRLPVTGMMRYSEAGVRKASREETAGEFAPAVVSVYGDLAPVYTLIFGLRTGTTAEQLPRRGFWSPCAGSFFTLSKKGRDS